MVVVDTSKVKTLEADAIEVGAEEIYKMVAEADDIHKCQIDSNPISLLMRNRNYLTGEYH